MFYIKLKCNLQSKFLILVFFFKLDLGYEVHFRIALFNINL